MALTVSDRYRRFRRVERRLKRAHVPRSASDRLAGILVGGGFQLRGEEVGFEVGGLRLVAPRRFASHYIEASYEPELTNWLQQHLAPGAVVIDAGAHIGYLSMVMAKFIGTGGRVYAVEPALENVDYLSRNVRANALHNVEILPVALGDQPALAAFNINSSSDSYGFFEHPNTATLFTRAVPVMSIDSLFSQTTLPRLDLIKIDVEGAELEVIAGLRATLERFPYVPLVVEWFPAVYSSRGLDADALPEELGALGYSVSVLDAAGGTPPTVRAAQEALTRNELPRSWYCNILAQRQACGSTDRV